MPGGLSDQELLHRCRRGDESAFTELFERHSDSVFQYAAVRMRSREEAREVVSYVFAEAWRQRNSIEPMDGTLRPWLFSVARNRTARLLAARIRTIHSSRWQTDAVAPDHADRVAERMDSAVRFERVLEAIDRLPEGSRDALTLHVWGELTYEEIAAELGVEMGTVKSRINRARRRLGAVLDPAGRHEPTGDVVPLLTQEDRR